MTMQEFRREWENIDDRFVLEAAGMQEKSEKRGKRGGGWGRRAALIAACIALLIGIPAFLFWRFSRRWRSRGWEKRERWTSSQRDTRRR